RLRRHLYEGYHQDHYLTIRAGAAQGFCASAKQVRAVLICCFLHYSVWSRISPMCRGAAAHARLAVRLAASTGQERARGHWFQTGLSLLCPLLSAAPAMYSGKVRWRL